MHARRLPPRPESRAANVLGAVGSVGLTFGLCGAFAVFASWSEPGGLVEAVTSGFSVGVLVLLVVSAISFSVGYRWNKKR